MSTSFVRIATPCTLGVALMMSPTNAIAIERTATKSVDQASTDLNTDMKVTAFTESIRAAVQALIDRVNLFDGRIDALETFSGTTEASLTSILARLAALEARAPDLAYLYDTWCPWVEAQLTSINNNYSTLNTRMTALESRGGGTTATVDLANCTSFSTTPRNWRYCPDGYFMNGIAEQGLATGSKLGVLESAAAG
jgi:hypothetical protein